MSDNHRNRLSLTSTLKSVAFSVYSQTLKSVQSKPVTTCLTGFGPISEVFVQCLGSIVFDFVPGLRLYIDLLKIPGNKLRSTATLTAVAPSGGGI